MLAYRAGDHYGSGLLYAAVIFQESKLCQLADYRGSAEMKRKSKPANYPHKVVNNPDAWWYEDEAGILILTTPPDRSRTLRVRILWKHLVPAAKRCGRLHK